MADEASDFWHSVFLCGTEWANFAEIYERPWDFDHLHEDLVAGTLAERGQPVYIFGATEPQLLDFEDGTPATIVAIPTLTAVSCGVAPPERLGINSVQMREEEIVPMRRHKMGWVPYFPNGEAPKKGTDGIPIHFLHCNERAANLKNMSEARREAYEYCIPYIFLPHLAKFEYTTVVSVLRNVEGKQLAFDFDWKFDDLDEFTEEILKNHNLPASAADEVKAGINEEVAAQKATLRAEKAAMNAEIEAIPEEDREALKDIYVVKYYPQNKAPNLDGFKSKFTNRYYPSANEVKPPVKKKKFAWGKKK